MKAERKTKNKMRPKQNAPVNYHIEGSNKLVANTGREIKFKTPNQLADFLHNTRLARQVTNLQELPGKLLHKI